MNLAKEVDEYIKESIDHSLGLTVSTNTLALKLRAYEDLHRRLQERCRTLQSTLIQKDDAIERARTEASMNAQAVKRFVEENQRLAAECAKLLGECQEWEKECDRYDRDREALMEFGNEADERAQEAEVRVQELEDEVRKLAEELRVYKIECEVNSSADRTDAEENLLQSALASVITEDGGASAHSFLESNSGHDSCQRLLQMWNQLKPSTQKMISVLALVKKHQREKEHLKVNLHKAEDEVNVLYEENEILKKEMKRLLRQCQREKSGSGSGSGGKVASSSTVKSNKRKSSLKMSSPVGKKMDFDGMDPVRQPLSPLQMQYNSPECGMPDN